MRIDGRSAEAARARAAVAAARGEMGEAARERLSRAPTWRSAPASRSTRPARGRWPAGRSPSRDPEEAIRELEGARATLDALGASRYRDEAARELRSLGKRTTGAKRGQAEIGEGIASLSEREGEVARLVAEGETNKQIAAELFLSEKTIEKHIARIFGKLEVSKRTQIAAAIGREGEPAR